MDAKKIENAGNYLALYEEYTEITEAIAVMLDKQTDIHQRLCGASKEFLELNDEELTRLLFYFDSIAQDARRVLDGNT